MLVKPVVIAAAVVFALVALAHGMRALFAVDVLVGGVRVPVWVSVAAFVVASALAVGLVRSARPRRWE